MALKIRLSRGGAKKRPFYRIVVADARSPRDGRFIERVGTYNPMVAKDSDDRVILKEERIKYWLSQGAKPSDRVARFWGRLRSSSCRGAPIRPNSIYLGRRPWSGEGEEEAAAAAAEAATAAAPAEAPVEEAPAEDPQPRKPQPRKPRPRKPQPRSLSREAPAEKPQPRRKRKRTRPQGTRFLLLWARLTITGFVLVSWPAPGGYRVRSLGATRPIRRMCLVGLLLEYGKQEFSIRILRSTKRVGCRAEQGRRSDGGGKDQGPGIMFQGCYRSK